MLGFSDSSIGVAASLLLHVGVAAACFGALGDGQGMGRGVVFVSLHGGEEAIPAHDPLVVSENRAQEPKPPTKPSTGAGMPVKVSKRSEAASSSRSERQEAEVKNVEPQRAVTASSAEEAGGGGLLGPLFTTPTAMYVPKPEYPTLARRKGIEGTVTLNLTVSETGAVVDAQVTKSSGAEYLDFAAVKAVREATFRPALRAGIPSVAHKTIAVRFSLTE